MSSAGFFPREKRVLLQRFRTSTVNAGSWLISLTISLMSGIRVLDELKQLDQQQPGRRWQVMDRGQ